MFKIWLHDFKLSPKEFWNKHVDETVEHFISFFLVDYTPVTEIKEMCNIYARELCTSNNKVYSVTVQKRIADILETHIQNHIKEMGGFDKLKLYSLEEVEAIEDESIRKLKETIDWYKNLKGY